MRGGSKAFNVHRYRAAVSGAATPSFIELLQQAGFHIRGRRADCRYCQSEGHGRGRATVAFNDEVAFCHRCKWKANVRILSRSLGVPIPREDHAQRERREQSARFSEWVNTCHVIIVRRLRRLTLRAEAAKRHLSQYPEYEPAWDALAEFCHNQPSLLAALDILSFEKLSPWLDRPMSRERLVAAFCDAEKRVAAEVPVAV
jgi:hypothetical protein